jgi:hypothetical protein
MNADHPSGLVPARWRHGIRRLRCLLFRFLPLAVRAWKGRMALRAEPRHRRSSASAVVRSNGGERRVWGLVVTGKGQLAAAEVLFCEIAQQPRPPPGQAPPVGSGPGGATTPGKDQHRSRRSRFLQNSATTLPPGSTRAGPRLGEGRAQVSAGVVFAKLRNDPGLRRGRLLPPEQASAAGLAPSGCAAPGKDGRRSGGRDFCEIAQRPRPPPGQAPPAGQAPAAGLAPGGCAAHVTAPGKDGRRSRGT